MSLIFTQNEDDKIEELQGLMDLALKQEFFDLAESIKLEVQDITEVAIVRAQHCLNSFMNSRNGNLPATLTEQAI